MRDLADNVVIICSIENLIQWASMTQLPQHKRLPIRNINGWDAAQRLSANWVETGGSNIQFAVNPEWGVVIEMNPRVSRSSTLPRRRASRSLSLRRNYWLHAG